MSLIEEIRDTLVVGNAPKVAELTEKALAEDATALEILNEGLVKGMDIVAEKWKNGEYYIPNVLIAARAMKHGMQIIKPKLAEGDYKARAVAVAGTVKGDLHDIGKNLVVMMLEGGGFEIVDAGIDVAPEKFVEVVKAEKPDLVGISALLTTTMPAMEKTIDALKAAGVRDSVKVMIGGAPVTQGFADEIGADGYAPDAASAVDLARALMGHLP